MILIVYLKRLNEINIHKSGCLVEYGNLSHKATRKSEWNGYTAFIDEPQNDPREVSPYTSPLKLFEYAASSKMIIASDTGSLRDVLTDQVYFIKWYWWIRKMYKNIKCTPKIENISHDDYFELGFKYTWANRVNKILKQTFRNAIDDVYFLLE